MKVSLLFVIATALTMGSATLQAVDKSAGEALYKDACAQCHGPNAQGMASFPSLSGRDAEYITSRLETYRAGEKVGSNSFLMIPNATGLSDDDIANLAAFITESAE
ncbi:MULTISPECIES: c-type cytochrome [Halomonadaceae]|uniref:C-type cytochrome n=2 Tax=Vreelandella TaxID=3137766 RepID=A0A7Z0LRN6_9GAMM|nr:MULTISPECIES: c-type cytochrome [Halomonas]NYS77306.1 c-type cytochrome [Halomonas glaciei]|tara:strand:- start:7678 stop:7995 length:318 start_codon:yes stop_codon:yes gene_type:complete